MLRMSTLFVRTLRDDPSDAEIPSHKLLVRAGYIRRAAPGGYTWLPLGWLVYRKVEQIVRQAMDDAGFQEVHFPALLPREPYEVTNRWSEYGDGLFRLKDRKQADYLLAPTHEEMFALLVKDLFSSYKDLPVSLYQIQTKYRDEARPRAGLLRGREFVMKDSYSFDVDDEGLARSYGQHRQAYMSLFDRLGVDYVIVAATSGAMGGSASEEFLASLPIGEDTYVTCRTCGYAANTEAVQVPVPASVDASGVPAPRVVDTPDTATITALVELFNSRGDLRRSDRAWTAADTLKNLVVVLKHPDGRAELLAIGVPGDREVDMKRLEAAVYPAEVAAATSEDFAAHPQLVVGYIGPDVLGADKPAAVRYLVDPRVVTGTRWITGANARDRHVVDLVAGRDFTPDGVLDVAEVREGDPCPQCFTPGHLKGARLEMARGVEIGHIFALGRKYADALGLRVLDVNGKQITPTMGSYGIGVSRLVAVLAEANHDQRGLVWPRQVAPADVHIVAAGKDAAVLAAAEKLAQDLQNAHVSVLFDDRTGVSAGVKFADAELLGMPTVVVVGKGLAEGVIEVRDRRTGERTELPAGAAASMLAELVRAERG